MSEKPSRDAAPQFGGRRTRSGHRRSPGDRAMWQIGVATAPPAATIGIAVAILGFLQPPLEVVPLVRGLAYLLVAVCVGSLGVILYGARPGSTRLRLKKVWLAIALALITIPALVYVDLRARRIAGNYVPTTAQPGGMDASPLDR